MSVCNGGPATATIEGAICNVRNAVFVLEDFGLRGGVSDGQRRVTCRTGPAKSVDKGAHAVKTCHLKATLWKCEAHSGRAADIAWWRPSAASKERL
jgi:hypothetical protein